MSTPKYCSGCFRRTDPHDLTPPHPVDVVLDVPRARLVQTTGAPIVSFSAAKTGDVIGRRFCPGSNQPSIGDPARSEV
jgi:hypothetical protein